MEKIDPTAEVVDLTAEQVVAADMAMLLDLGRAEELADVIAAQSGGACDTVINRHVAETQSPSETDSAGR